MLSKEERDALELDRCNAKQRCRDSWSTICQLEEMLKTYRNDHFRWSRRFEEADRRLAEEDKVIKLPIGEKAKKQATVPADDVQLLVKLDRSQLRRIAEALGVEMEEE